MANGNQTAALEKVETPENGNAVEAGLERVTEEERLFALAQRKAKVYSESSLVPQEYRGKIGNVLIAENMARRMGADTLMVMQNLYIVHGKPAWSAAFLIACFNSCGRFSAIKYRFDGEGDDYGCTAYCTELSTGDTIEGPKVTLGMAKKEGWHGKTGSKWQTLPNLMFRYRAGTFLVRTTAPEIGMGLQTREEVEDIGPANGDAPVTQGVAGLKGRMGIDEQPKADVTVEAIEDEETDGPDVAHVDAEIFVPEGKEDEAPDVALTARHQVEQIVYELQKKFGVKAAELNLQLPEGVKKFSDLSEEQAAEVLPSVQQILESKQAG